MAPRTIKNSRLDETRKSLSKGSGDLPAIFVDEIFCDFWRGHIKISFAESIGGERRYRAAILMETDTVEFLMGILQDCLEHMATHEKDDSEEDVLEGREGSLRTTN